MKQIYSLKIRILSLLFCLFLMSTWALDETVLPGENIQSAIDNVAASGGGIVTLAAGTHNINVPVRMKSNVTLQGEGNWASLLKTSVNMKMIIHDAEGLVNLVIRNLAIEGTNAPNGGGIEITANDNVEHDNVQIINVHCYKTGWGVHVKGTTNLLVKDCLFEENGTVGQEGYAHNMYLRRVYGAEVRNSKFLNSTSANGINISYSRNIKVYNCEMTGNYFRGIRAAVTEGYLVHDCVVKNNGDVGIFANAERGIVTTNIDIKRNCVSNNGKDGIKALNNATGEVSDNNSFGNGSVSGTDYSLPSAVMQSNNITDSSSVCVYSESPSVALTASAGDGFVTLNWGIKNITLTGQDIFRNTDANPNGRTIIASNVNLSTFSYTDNSVVNGTTYWYWVKATDASTNSYDSNSARVTPNILEPKVILTASAGDGFVTLNWEILNINAQVVGLFRDTDDDASGRKLVRNYLTGTTYTDNSVVNETEYWYWLKVTDDQGVNRQNDAAINALPSASLSVEDNFKYIKISAYPNPVKDVLTVESSSADFNEYTIYDINGRVNMSGVIPTGEKYHKIDIRLLAKGIYIMSLKGENINKTLRIVKN